MCKNLFVTVAILLAVSVGGVAVAEKTTPNWGYCWISSDGGAPARSKDDAGHLKMASTFPEGKRLYISEVKGSEVWVGGFFVRRPEVAFDPRLTRQWEAMRVNSLSPSLWKRIEEMANSADNPTLTEAIVQDLVDQKVIPGIKTRKDLGPPKNMAKRFSERQLDEMLLRYSQLAPKGD